MGDFNRQADPAKRAQLWSAVQQVVYTEVPYINVGKFSSLSARQARMQGYTPSACPCRWNPGLPK